MHEMGRIKQALILVGGKGERLGSITAHTPKPLLEIAPGLRFLDVVLDQIARHGFTEIILLAGHMGEQVEALYRGNRVREAIVKVVREPEPAGTGGALTFAADMLDPWFLMANGDSYFDINLRTLAAAPLTDFVGRLALREVSDRSRYGSAELVDDRIEAFCEKNSTGVRSGLMSSGIYVLNREILNHVRAPCSLERETFPVLAQAGRLRGMTYGGYFLDIGLPDTFEQASRELPGRLVKPAAFLGSNVVLNREAICGDRPNDLVWIRGAREAILRLNEAGYFVFFMSNQDDLGRNDLGALQTRQARMQDELAAIGAHIDAFYLGPVDSDAMTEPFRTADRQDRSSIPEIFVRAMREWPVDLGGSVHIDDCECGLDAARRAGLRALPFEGGYLKVLTEVIQAPACASKDRSINGLI